MSNFTKLKLCHTLGISQNTHFWVKGALTALLLVLCGNVAKAQSYQSFDANKNYTKILIDAKINDFAGNTKPMGFGSYDATSETITQPTWYTAMDKESSRKLEMDYVAGLVAKACIEAADYYKDFTWSKPWFKLVENYAMNVTVPTTGASLDDLNASKMYFALAELTKSGAKYENSTTYNKAITELKKALTGLKAVNNNYSIRSGSTVNYYSDGKKQTFNLVDAKGNELSPATSGMNAIGGWYHKATYPNEMWCDSEYMGPALLAQLVAYAANNKSAGIGTITGTTEGDWKLIAKQFDITWNYLWNSTDELLYHGFSATPNAVGAHTYTWATGTNGTNTAYWGRAIGWYFLALVDVLENMPDNISDDSYTSTQDNLKNKDANIKNRLKSYLTDLAEGIWKQKKDNNLWTNVINEAVGTEHNSYSTTDAVIQSNKKNYLEASASAIYIATYLKAMRLGLLPSDYISGIQTAYQNYISNFITTDNNIINTCASAGLGGGNVNISSANSDYKSGGKKYRNGTADYYTRGYDVTKITSYQEGKPLGAFILASTEYERFMKADYAPSFAAENAEIPTAQTVTKGQSVTLHAATMAKPLAKYQWYSYPASDTQASKAKRAATTGTAIPGATSSDLTVTPEADTYYYCEATNDKGSATTEPVLLTVSEGGNEGTNTPSETEVTGKVIYFKGDGTTTTNESVLTVTSGSMKSGASTITYKDVEYKYALKINSDASVTLKLSSKSDVVLVFNPSNSGNKIKVNGTEYTIDTNGLVTISSLTAGNYVITRSSDESNFYAVDIQPTGPSISISSLPESTDYLTGATVTPLSVAVTFNNATESDYTVTYQWKKNKENSTTGGDVVGTNATTYTPEVNTAGTSYYYCVVTATLKTDETKTLSATSNVAMITVSDPYVKFTTQPSDAQYSKGATATALSAEATTNISGATISYQWYSNTTGSIPDDKSSEKISSATSATYTPSTTETGITYYYCVASVENGSETVTATSDIVSVEVMGKLYSFKVNSETPTPACNESWYITGDTNNDKLVKMTFGGWKYNSNKYLKPNADDIDKNYITDSWNAPAKQDKVTALDGYEYAITGKYDAVHEDKTATTEMYKKTRYGWFVSPKRVNGITTKSFPFTLPVRGAYMTFEPTQNGTLTIYLLQNGAWNSDKNNNIIPGEFRMHAFQITNQRGLVLEEFAPQYEITVNQKVMDGYSCSQYTNDPGTGNYNPSSKDISDWEEFWTLNDEERKAVHDNWANGKDGSQTIIKLKNGSFLAIQKAIVKYQFHVTGNETYYMFSNFSKLGFSGATFQPDDAQPTDATTFSGDNSLNDTKAFTKIQVEEDGTIPGNTNMVNYKYTIGGKEVGKVAGVFIPQFKEITLNRTFKKDLWTTLTLPFNLTEDEVQSIFGAGTRLVMLKEGTIKNGGAHLTFIYHEIQNVLPGYPYLIKPKKDVNSFTANNKCINPHITQYNVDCGDYWHKGTPDYSTAVYSKGDAAGYSIIYPENDIFVSEGNGNLYVSSGASYGKGYRSWIAKKTVAEGGTSQTAKSISVVMSSFSDDDDTTTSIDVAEMAPDLIEALGIQTGVYNLSGQRVANDTRNLKAGIYIVNGKKTVVR